MPSTPSSPWHSLERVPGQIALPVTWHRLLGDDFAAFRMLCLQASTELPRSYPCPLRRSCAQAITPRPHAPPLPSLGTHPPQKSSLLPVGRGEGQGEEFSPNNPPIHH